MPRCDPRLQGIFKSVLDRYSAPNGTLKQSASAMKPRNPRGQPSVEMRSG